MEERALLVNIATILAKDIMLDKDDRNKVKTSTAYPSIGFNHFILDDNDDDDDDLDLLVYEMQQRGDFSFPDDERIASALGLSDSLEEDHVDDDDDDDGDENVDGIPSKSCSLLPFKGRRQNVNFHLGDYFTRNEFERNLHLKKSTFYKILRTLRSLIETRMRDINGVIVTEESFISLGLWKLTTDEHFEEISRRFHVPLDVCHWTVNNFCNLISTNLQTFVTWPTSREKQNEILEKFNEEKSSFGEGTKLPDLFGIIALRQIDIFFESQDEEASVILQVICTSDQKLIDCYVDFAASYSFSRTPTAKRMSAMESDYMPKNSYLIGDCSFPLQKYLMRPFEKPSNEKERRFNAILEEKRSNIMESVLNKMQKRFHSLYALEAKNIKEAKKILETICALHNIYETNRDDYLHELDNFSDGKRFTYGAVGCETDEDGRIRRNALMGALQL